MNNILENYPLLDNDLIVKSKINIIPDAYYTIDDNVKKLKLDQYNNNLLLVVDDEEIWSPKNNNLFISYKVEIDNPREYYSKVAGKNSKLGIVLTWSCKSTKTVKSTLIKTFDYTEEKLNFITALKIDKGEIANKINISFKLVMIANNDSKNYAKIVGAELGELQNEIIEVEGNGSIFPMVLIKDESGPLWEAVYNFDPDELNEELNLNKVCLRINVLHKNYKKEDYTLDGENMTPIFKEILSQFFVFLFYRANSIEEIRSEKYDNGTIGAFIQNLLYSFDVDMLDEINDLSKKIRKKIDSLDA